MAGIRIGFDEDEELNVDNSSESPRKVGHRYYSQDEPPKELELSPRRIKQIEDSYDCVVVHDYGDDYHLSDEERAKNNKFYEAFSKLVKTKKKYRKVDQYVTVMRMCLECLDKVAEGNGVYDPDEFKKMYFKGKIYISGLEFPKYVGKSKNDIDPKFLTQFILSDKDPKELLPKENEGLYTEDEFEEAEKRLFPDGELDRILSKSDLYVKGGITRAEQRRLDLFDPEVDEVRDGENIVLPLTKKEAKRFYKANPEMELAVRNMKRKTASRVHMNRFVSELDEDDLDQIERYDQKHNYATTNARMPEFTGDIFNDEDYNRYLRAMEEYEENNIKEYVDGRLRTQSDVKELELKRTLEEAGWNIRNLYDNREKERKAEKALKKDKKRERKLKEQLLEAKNRRKRRLGEAVDEDTKSKKKKKKKKSKKIRHLK